MDSDRRRKVESIFGRVIDASASRREGVLAEACAGDEALRREVESLLAEDASRSGLPQNGLAHDFLPGDVSRPSAGSQLGPYRIESSVGKGGMGEVWKARDTRLNRVVAIKVSARQFSDRFEREARAIAALNHPNICTLYDVGPNYLVMEYIEGTPLEGPLPVDQALKYAGQLCDALDAAHRSGILHRDLKRGNVLIAKQGIKLLDFGLAQMEAAAGDPAMTQLTQTGAVMGTPAYMAPEQWEGKKADTRSDIYAFGCVLYEMLTGKRVGPGRAPVSPRALEEIVRTCLEKDPDERWQSARDLKHALRLAAEARPAAAAVVPSRFGKTGWIVAAVLLAAALGSSYIAWRYYDAEPQVLRVTLQIPEYPGVVSTSIPAISPDGRYVVLPTASTGKVALWLRSLNDLSAHLLPGSEGGNARLPFWSPDSRWIGFFDNGKLKKIAVDGGQPVTLCSFDGVLGGTWNQEGSIIFGSTIGLSLVPAAGGTPTLLAAPDAAEGEAALRAPWFLPDGRHFLYTARSTDPQKTRVYVDSIDARPGSHTRREVLAAASNAVYVPQVRPGPAGRNQGYLLFARENTLMAQPFDASALRTTGEAVTVAEGVDYSSAINQSQFSASQNGILVYTSGAAAGGVAQLTWLDRAGKARGTIGPPGLINWASISPDDSRVATSRTDSSGLSDIWINGEQIPGAEARFFCQTLMSGLKPGPIAGARTAHRRHRVEQEGYIAVIAPQTVAPAMEIKLGALKSILILRHAHKSKQWANNGFWKQLLRNRCSVSSPIGPGSRAIQFKEVAGPVYLSHSATMRWPTV